MLCLLLMGLLAYAETSPVNDDGCKKIVCYFTNWAQHRPGYGRFMPYNINLTLCTHMVYAYAKLKDNHLDTSEQNDDSTRGTIGLYQKFVDQKKKNPKVKALLGVDGWKSGSYPFSQMLKSATNRRIFINDSITFLRKRNFDGLDLVWQYSANGGSSPENRMKFTCLVKELVEAYHDEAKTTGKPRLLLTAAVAARSDIIDASYDIPNISRYLDFISVKAYDMYGPGESVTGHVSPLYARSTETGFKGTLNVDSATRHWASKGAPKEKLIIGVPLYGRSFTLSSANKHEVGDPVKGPGSPGTYTKRAGFLSYYEVCDMIKAGGRIKMISKQSVAFVYSGTQWVGSESRGSLRAKVQYVKDNNYGGVMVWSLSLDDFSGTYCGQGPFPLMNAIYRACEMSSGTANTPSPVDTPSPVVTTASPTSGHIIRTGAGTGTGTGNQTKNPNLPGMRDLSFVDRFKL